MTDVLMSAISALRELCNREISQINKTGGGRTPVSFERINNILKACDKVFEAADLASLNVFKVVPQTDGLFAVEGRGSTRGVFEAFNDAVAFARLLDASVEQPKREISDDQIQHMVNRFLGWRLPENFHPDAGISFKAEFNEHTDYPMKHEPIGTNLFDAVQTEAMVRYMIEGLPRQES